MRTTIFERNSHIFIQFYHRSSGSCMGFESKYAIQPLIIDVIDDTMTECQKYRFFLAKNTFFTNFLLGKIHVWIDRYLQQW